MLQSEAYKNQPPMQAVCILGIKNEDEVLSADDLTSVPGLGLVLALSQPSPDWRGYRGRVTKYLSELPREFPWREWDYYLCGNGAMIQEVRELLHDRGVENQSIIS